MEPVSIACHTTSPWIAINWIEKGFPMVFTQIKVGDQLPNCSLATLVNDAPSEVRLHQLMAKKAVVIFGLVGAYVPACTRHHVPNILEGIDKLQSAGIDQVFCFAENDPWVLDS